MFKPLVFEVTSGPPVRTTVSDATTTTGDGPPECYGCGAVMVAWSCKMKCPNCGLVHDCSDGAY